MNRNAPYPGEFQFVIKCLEETIHNLNHYIFTDENDTLEPSLCTDENDTLEPSLCTDENDTLEPYLCIEENDTLELCRSKYAKCITQGGTDK